MQTKPQNKPLDFVLCTREAARTFAIFNAREVAGAINKLALAKHSQFLRRQAERERRVVSVARCLFLSPRPEPTAASHRPSAMPGAAARAPTLRLLQGAEKGQVRNEAPGLSGREAESREQRGREWGRTGGRHDPVPATRLPHVAGWRRALHWGCVAP